MPTRTERHVIKESNSLFLECEGLGFKSKNLYNACNYKIRQRFFHNQKHPEDRKKQWTFPLMVKALRKAKQPDWEAFGKAQRIPTQVVKLLFQNWTSYYAALKEYRLHPAKFKACPKPPGYLHKEKGRQVTNFESQAISNNWKQGVITPSTTSWTIPFQNYEKAEKVNCVRVVPKLGYYVIEIVYTCKQIKAPKGKRIAAIDLGLNNLATVITNGSSDSYIINGRPIKAINAYYNKLLAKAKSALPNGVFSSRYIRNLWRRRDFKIKDYLHKATSFLVEFLYQQNVNRIAVGMNHGWKQNINLGKKTNQNFVLVPFATMISMLKYKCEDRGMELILQEEAYTSKASALDLDPLFEFGSKPEGTKFSGKRIKRGLYKTKDGTLINADVNGALNIFRKQIPEEVMEKWLDSKVIHKRFSEWIKGFAISPVRLVPNR